jgi:hypothetical protein
VPETSGTAQLDETNSAWPCDFKKIQNNCLRPSENSSIFTAAGGDFIRDIGSYYLQARILPIRERLYGSFHSRIAL